MKKKETSSKADLRMLFVGIFLGILGNFFSEVFFKVYECIQPVQCWEYFVSFVIIVIGLIYVTFYIWKKIIKPKNITKKK
jgi:H+/Cl- antiporter ClcA